MRDVPGMRRAATVSDLEVIASWITTARECELWAGWRVAFPIDRTSLAAAIGFAETDAIAVADGQQLLAFGQLAMKNDGRGHLGRLIVNPAFRGRGYGEELVRALLDRAQEKQFERVSLNVDAGNIAAVSLYLKVGFEDGPRPSDEPESPGSRYMERAV